MYASLPPRVNYKHFNQFMSTKFMHSHISNFSKTYRLRHFIATMALYTRLWAGVLRARADKYAVMGDFFTGKPGGNGCTQAKKKV